MPSPQPAAWGTQLRRYLPSFLPYKRICGGNITEPQVTGISSKVVNNSSENSCTP
jgi:hypothetical protein